jgi:putative peptide zinc metalloprotease protein
VTLYVLTVVPLLLFMFGMMVINAPRIFSTAYDSFFVQYHKVQHDFSGGSALHGVIGVFQMIILVLPTIGIVATFWLLLKRMFGAVWARTEGYPIARGAFVIAASAAGAFLGYIWWPNGDYRPIQPGEKGTIQGAVEQFAMIPTGRPSLTKARERALGGAPLKSAVVDKTPVAPDQTVTQTTQTTTTPSQTVSTPAGTTQSPAVTTTTTSTAATTTTGTTLSTTTTATP